MARVVNDNARKQAQLEDALAQRRNEHVALEERLTQMRNHVTELEREVETASAAQHAEKHTPIQDPAQDVSATAYADAGSKSQTPISLDAPIVLSTPNQAVSFRASDVTYAESLNRVRIVHLKSGESIQINMTLAQIAEALPPHQFLYCHRSVVVNLSCVKSTNSTELTLYDGTKLPMSRRMLPGFQGRSSKGGIYYLASKIAASA